MGEFFFISMSDEIDVNIFTVQRWDIFWVVEIILTSFLDKCAKPLSFLH